MLKNILPSCLTIALCSASSLALAHTGIKDQATEGSTLYTGFTITHGCGDSSKDSSLDVIAQSVVFPNGPDADVTNLSDSSPIDISTVINGATGPGENGNGGLTNLSPAGIQDKSVFDTLELIKDANGNTRGFKFSNSTEGRSLQHDLVGIIPFRTSGLTFNAESCAKSLKVRIAIANWCTQKAGVRRADIWIAHTTPAFNDARIVSAGYWPTMTVNRNLTTNPLPEACGAGFDVAVEPSDIDIDQYLPMPGFISGN